MKIRRAVPNDLDWLYLLAISGLEETGYKEIGHSEHHVRKVVGDIILSGFAWVADDLSGALLAYLQPAWFNPGITISTDLFFYVKNTDGYCGIKLIKKYILWGDENASKVALSISFGDEIEKTEKFYSRFGFSKIGGAYLRG